MTLILPMSAPVLLVVILGIAAATLIIQRAAAAADEGGSTPSAGEQFTSARQRVHGGLRRSGLWPGSRRPFLPQEDRPPLTSRVSFTCIEDYVAEGYRALQVHLMQAARGSQQP